MPKVLVVEDNEMNRDMLTRRLERRGYEVISAVDGEDGMNKARSGSPDIILMDMDLPVLDGWAATRQLKAAPETQSIPVIALTAHAMAGDREKSLEAGCDDYDTKPVEFSRLIEKIEKLLGKGS
ncbi:MAG: response regulator [Chloroflexi bacterium]|nr:response regulator [Chloroflexota bacterium]MCI0788942.1 response regulator [Chloroflexota bacterium]MCI0801417.1 response regulator [Chloroflexota bacterium]MCI0812105.1 response regulator [Chloroflexota bacterium]MCI0829801.1 response regulator [Chloroflexota bacterium]